MQLRFSIPITAMQHHAHGWEMLRRATCIGSEKVSLRMDP